MRMFAINLLLMMVLVSCNKTEPTPENRNQHRLFYDEEVLAQLKDRRIDEASGIAESLRYPGHFWVHNDSGDEARIFLINRQGETVVTLMLQGITHRDWEDIATGQGVEQGESYIYVGEIGDNSAQHTYKNIYRLKEPVLVNLNKGQNVLSEKVETITFRYIDGNRDAETLIIDSQTKDIYIVSKREERVQVYLLEYPQTLTDTLVVPVVQTLPYTRVTAGDISADGTEILLKTLNSIYYWKRNSTETISDALGRQAEYLPYFLEPQGEAIAWLKDGSGYITVSEMSNANVIPILYFYRRK